MTLLFFSVYTFFILVNCIISTCYGDPQTVADVDASSYIKEAASILADKFKETTTNELGTLAAAEMMASLKSTNFALSDDDLLLTISEKLSCKLKAAVGLLKSMRNIIVNDSNIPSFTHPCHLNSLRSKQLKNLDGHFVVTSESIPKYISVDTKGKVVYKLYGHNKDLKVQRQYFLSSIDLGIDEDCTSANQGNLRKMFYRVYQPNPLNILFIFDDMTSNEMEFQQAVVILREILNTLRTDDRVALTFVLDKKISNFTKVCLDKEGVFANATNENCVLMMDYLFQIKRINFTLVDYSSVSNMVLEHLLANSANEDVEIIFITNNASSAHLLNEGFTKRISNKYYFSLSVFLALENSPDNSTIYNLYYNRDYNSLKSNEIEDLEKPLYTAEQVLSLFYLSLPKRRVEQVVSVNIPYWEATSRDFVVPFLLPCNDRGILGLDLFLSDLAEDVIYLKKVDPLRKVFIMDLQGIVIMHSVYPRPELVSEKLNFIDITQVEKYPQIMLVKNAMLSHRFGNMSIPDKNYSLVFTWTRVQALFIVCVISRQNNYDPSSKTFTATRTIRDVLYHRIDLFPPETGSLCRHFKQVATIEKGTVYLSPSSFHSPFSYLHDIKDGKDSSFITMQSYLAYLKDKTRLLSNPGLKPEIRNDVAVLNPLLHYFKEQHMQSGHFKYIVRRYAATESGVLVNFPGSILDFDYEPVRKAWFITSFDSPKRIIFTPPYLDVGGSGYIITLSYALRMSFQTSTIVLAMDVTMGYIYKYLIDNLPVCSQPKIKCFLMDDRGYLVSHPGLIDPSSTGPVEQQHITHKESLIANDILNHRGFVKKQLCNNNADGTIQRYYEFNSSFPDVISNIISGDRCVHYEIGAIPGTNIFIGVVNSTCEVGAFCPCSMVDRVCLNCNRMEQNECECPCECQSTLREQCSSELTMLTDAPMCKLFPEKSTFKNNYYYSMASRLKSCFEFKCDVYSTRDTCLGVLGCEWCQIDTDAETYLSSPFCASQLSCFNGILGAITPYGEGSYGHIAGENILTSYSAVGPVAGCIVAVCLIVAIAIYCYRENSSNSNGDVYPRASADNWPEHEVQLYNLSPDNDINGECSGHQDKLLPVDPSAPVSPYKILTGYKRPNTTGDSDHGYSTMTPHEDSEHLAFALSGPINLLSDAHNNSSDDCSVDTSASSPRIKQNITEDGMTFIPCGKNILAQVTVHRHMEAL